MTAEPAKNKATYQDLFTVPDGMTAEIIDGELVVSPKLSPRHALATTALGSKIPPKYDFGEGGGPGGWVILPEVEIMFGDDLLAPDWICEIISPSTVGKVRIVKMNIYARFDVSHCWLIDPRDRILEVFKLQAGFWTRIGAFMDDARVRVEPFPEVELGLGGFWVEEDMASPVES